MTKYYKIKVGKKIRYINIDKINYIDDNGKRLVIYYGFGNGVVVKHQDDIDYIRKSLNENS